jgi:4'-phosphopantetheinyl transferase EntD
MNLFPSGVIVAECEVGAHGDLGLREEETVVARAAPKRRLEFAAGRAAARTALRRLGVADSPILANPDRSPCWPDGVVGSISHKAGLAIAAVARREEFAGIGLDTEPAEPVEERLWRRILTETEIDALPADGTGVRARLLFSAKETFHKCIHPAFGVFFDFREASFTIDAGRGTFAVEVRREVPEGFPTEDRLVGRWVVQKGRILTAMAIAAEDVSFGE